MAKRRKFYKTTVQITVLSEDAYPHMNISPENILRELDTGDWSGQVIIGQPVPLTQKRMAAECEQQGTAPEFFGIDSKGRTINGR